MLNSEGAAAACPSILRGREWRNFAAVHKSACGTEPTYPAKALMSPGFEVVRSGHRFQVGMSAIDPNRTSKVASLLGAC